jgi:hypothetical protein
VELMSANIQSQGGRVVKFSGKALEGQIDFVVINPKLQVENVRSKIQGKVSYKEIIDYHFINESLKAGRLQNVEKYSLFVNVEEL